MKRTSVHTAVLLTLPALCAFQSRLMADGFFETDLVSDIPGRAARLDPNLVNPWGIASSPTSPFWVSDNGSGVSTLYDGTGLPRSLVVTVPPTPGGTPPGTPTGVIFNGGSGFEVAPGSPARFIFATEDGTISGWNPTAAATAAILKVADGGGAAVYKGLASGHSGSGDFLYAANFRAGTIDVFDSNFAATTLSGNFTDPSIPSGYAPFNVQNLGGKLYVTYAMQDGTAKDDVAGAGHGFVDVFDLGGNFVKRLVSQGALNSPWGLAIADAGFGPFASALLVGNFGDGRVNAYDPSTGSALGFLSDLSGNPIEITGLWGLTFGNGGSGGNRKDLYFTAGIPGSDAVEDHGLFGQIVFTTPEGGPSTGYLFGAILVCLGASLRQGRLQPETSNRDSSPGGRC